MLDLPMLAFQINGIDESIDLTIEEVWGFPHEPDSYCGGYGAKGRVTVQAGEYSVSAMHYFSTGELYKFLLQLELCYERLDGNAMLENLECELELKCEFNRLGHVIVLGRFQADLSVGNALDFEIRTDQTQVRSTLSQLRTVFDIFGGNEGKKQ